MTTYAEIATRVAGIVVNPSPYVQSQIARLVHEAQKEAERRHIFAAMRGVWMIQTQAGSHETVPGLGAMLSPQSPLADSAAYTFLRTIPGEQPVRVEFPALPSWAVLAGNADGQVVTLGNDTGMDGRLTFTVEPVPNNMISSASYLALAKFKPGMWFRALFGGLTDPGKLDGVPLLIERVTLVETGVLGIWRFQLTARAPDAFVAVPSTVYNAMTLQVVWAPPLRTHAMAWLDDRSRAVLYGNNEQPGDAKHLEELGQDEVGRPRFRAYPRAADDATGQHIAVPAAFHLTASLIATPNQDRQSWFTNFAGTYLEQRAAAAAFELEEDWEQAQRYRAMAEGSFKELRRDDAMRQVKSETLPYSHGARGTVGGRPRL
jgi:hypothetical protein